MLPHRFLPEALADFEAGVDFYLARAAFNPEPAARFEAAVLAALAEVCEAPTRWPRVDADDDVRRCQLARPFQEWAFLYVVEEAVIVIIAVAHGRRRPGYWRDR